MPEETRVAVQRENEGGVMKRVVRDRGIFPAGAVTKKMSLVSSPLWAL